MIVCVATRGRPMRFARLIESFWRTRSCAKLYIRIDDDDPCCESYRAVVLPHYAKLECGPRVDVAGAMRECLAACPDEDCYAFIGDDTIIHTQGFDARLRDAAGPWGVSYPDDGLKGVAQATHPFIGGDFLRAIGFWALPGLSHLYTDTTWDFLGRRYGNLTYCPRVLVEHLHWSAGKSERDAIYDHPSAGRDQQCFLSWTEQFQIDPVIAEKIAASARERSAKSMILVHSR